MKAPPIFTIFDLETTSKHAKEARIVQIAMKKVQDGKVLSEWSQIIDPGIDIPESTTKVHGISTKMAKEQGIPLRQGLERFLGESKGTILVGHNISSYDVPVVEREALRTGLSGPKNELIDTLRLAREEGLTKPAKIQGAESFKLADLIKYEGAHNAAYDVRANEKLFYQQLREAKISSLDELHLKHSRAFGATKVFQAQAYQGQAGAGLNRVRERLGIMLEGQSVTSATSTLKKAIPHVSPAWVSKAKTVGMLALGGLTISHFAKTFSGKDDAYNTIEGLRHGGMASQTRPEYGFGSGWLGQGRQALRAFTQSQGWKGYRRYVRPGLAVAFGMADIAASDNKAAATLANVGSTWATFATRRMTGIPSYFLPTATYIGGRLIGETLFGAKGQDQGLGGAVHAITEKKLAPFQNIMGDPEGSIQRFKGDPHPYISPSYNEAQDIPAYELARASSMGVSENELYKRMSRVSHPSETLQAYAAAGTALHMVEERRMTESGQAVSTEGLVHDPVNQIAGHIDVVEAGNVPADVKTVSRKGFERLQESGKPKAAHVGQVQFYMHALGASKGRIHYVMREDPSQRTTMEFDYDPALMGHNLRKLARVRGRIKRELASGVLKEENLPRAASLETLMAYEEQEQTKYSSSELQKIFRDEMQWLQNVKRNKALNPIKGHDAGRWGREQTFASGDFRPGSSWKGILGRLGSLFKRAPQADWSRITQVTNRALAVEAQVAGSVTGFAAQAERQLGVTSMFAPARDFPKKYFNYLSGRTVAYEGMTAEAMVAHPSMLKESLVGTRGQLYKGSIVHEALEKEYATFAGNLTHGHFSADVMRGQGLFLQKLGVSWKDIRTTYGKRTDLGLMKQGWKHGKRLQTNINSNTISGFPEQGIGAASRKDYGFGSPWEGIISKLVDPMIALSKSAGTLKGFAKGLGVRMVEKASPLFPIEKFHPGSARTLINTGSNISKFKASTAEHLSATQRLIAQGEFTLMPMIAAPGALRGFGIAESRIVQKQWMGSAVHEKLEAEFFKRAKQFDLELIKQTGHISPNVLRGQGYFLQGTGVNQEQLLKMGFKKTDLKVIQEGFEYGAKAAAERAANQQLANAKSYLDKIPTPLEMERQTAALARRTLEVARQKRAQTTLLMAEKQKQACPQRLFKRRRNSHGKNG